MSTSRNNQPLRGGSKPVRDRLNKDREDVDSLIGYNLRGGTGVSVQHVRGAQTIGINYAMIGRRLPHGRIGTNVRRAFVKSTPASGSTVDVYLDTDGTGEEVTVTCTFYDDSGEGGSFADTIRPKLTDGTPFVVFLDGGTWRNETPLFKGSVS